MTGAERGACEDITGTPYVGADQLAQACGSSAAGEPDFPSRLSQRPGRTSACSRPARAAQPAPASVAAV
jgi:hypothetical protein